MNTHGHEKAHTTNTHTAPQQALPPNEDAVVDSSTSSVLKSSSVPTPAKGGEVTGGASGSLGPRRVPWGEWKAAPLSVTRVARVLPALDTFGCKMRFHKS